MVNWTRKRPRQNKANSGTYGEAPEGQRQLCETKPISPAGGPGGRNVQNEPNSAQPPGRSGPLEAKDAKRSQFRGGQACPSAGTAARSTCGTGRTNKANLPAWTQMDAGRRSDQYKQSQLTPDVRKWARTSRPQREFPPGTNVRNEASFPVPGRRAVDCFAALAMTWGRSRRMTLCLPCDGAEILLRRAVGYDIRSYGCVGSGPQTQDRAFGSPSGRCRDGLERATVRRIGVGGPYAVYRVMHVLQGETGGIHTCPASILPVPSWRGTSPFRKGGGSARILPRGAVLSGGPPNPVCRVWEGFPNAEVRVWGPVGRLNQKEDQQCERTNGFSWDFSLCSAWVGRWPPHRPYTQRREHPW